MALTIGIGSNGKAGNMKSLSLRVHECACVHAASTPVHAHGVGVHVSTSVRNALGEPQDGNMKLNGAINRAANQNMALRAAVRMHAFSEPVRGE